MDAKNIFKKEIFRNVQRRTNQLLYRINALEKAGYIYFANKLTFNKK